MVLYHLATTYQIIMGITHRLVYHPDEKAVLVMPSYMTRTYPQYNDLITLNLFDEVLLFPRDNTLCKKGMAEEEVLLQIEMAYNEMTQYAINSFDYIYIACSHHLITIYILLSNVNFSIFEEACGQLSRYDDHFRTMLRSLHSSTYEYIEKYNLLDLNYDRVIHKICNIKAQKEGFYDEKAFHFDVVRELIDLPDVLREKIIAFFKVPENIEISDNSAILMTQHTCNLKFTSFEGQILLFQLICDYFLENYDVVIKPHPEDIADYVSIFPKSKIIKETFPSEFLPFAFSQTPKMLATAASTGLRALEGIVDTILTFDNDIFYSFHAMHSYYFALRYAQIINKGDHCYSIGINRILMENLAKYGGFEQTNFIIHELGEINDVEKELFVIVDAADDTPTLFREKIIQLMDFSCTILFINSGKDYWFYDVHHNIDRYLRPIVIKKYLTGEIPDNIYEIDGKEVCYLYSKNNDNLEKAVALHYSKELPNTGVTIKTELLGEKEMEFLLLKAKLEAAERRLLELIEEKKGVDSNV